MLNRVILIGRLVKDPELRYTPSGVAVCNFVIAVDRPYTNNEGEREADFPKITVWRQLAETCANHLGKGRLVAVEGRLEIKRYEKDGTWVYDTAVVCDVVRFLDSKPDRDRQDF